MLMLSTAAIAADKPNPLQGFYVGGSSSFGGSHWNQGTVGGTFAIGYNLNNYISIEADFDHTPAQRGQIVQEDAHVGVVVGYPLGRWTPSVSLGTGLGWYGNGNSKGNALPIYVVGAGVSYNITDHTAVSVQYSYMGYFDSKYLGQNGVSLGIAYNF